MSIPVLMASVSEVPRSLLNARTRRLVYQIRDNRCKGLREAKGKAADRRRRELYVPERARTTVAGHLYERGRCSPTSPLGRSKKEPIDIPSRAVSSSFSTSQTARFPRSARSPACGPGFLVPRGHQFVGLSSNFFGQDFLGPAQSRVSSRDTDGGEGEDDGMKDLRLRDADAEQLADMRTHAAFRLCAYGYTELDQASFPLS